MPNIPQITNPISNKNYSFNHRAFDSNVEPFDMVQLTQPLTAQQAQDRDARSALLMGQKNLAPMTANIHKDPTMAVETLKDLLNLDVLNQTLINGYTDLYGDMDELIKALYLSPDKLVEEIQNQEKQNTMFSGHPLYKMLHSLLKSTTNPETKENIGNLLKALNYSQNKNEILNALSANMKFLSEYFSPNASLSAKLANLSNRWLADDAPQLFEMLKNETLAMLKEVSGSLLNDERTQIFIPLVIHNISRYNTNPYMLKETFNILMAQVPSNSLRREMSDGFNDLLSLLFTQKEISEMGDYVNNNDTINSQKNQAFNEINYSNSNNSDEKLSISLFISSRLSDSDYLNSLNLSEENINSIVEKFFSGSDSGLITLRNIIQSFLSGSEGRSEIPILLKEFSQIKDISTLVDYLNDILRSIPEIPQRDNIYKMFVDIVNIMVERKELPAEMQKPAAPSTLNKLTDFISKNINHQAIQSLDNFNASSLLQSLLNAPGVFTPLAHYVLPLQIDNTKAFGELWVDNDENNPNNTPSGQKNYHLFLTFDIESVGRFEVDLYALGENVNVSLLYPKSFTYRVDDITAKIENKIAQIGYKTQSFKTAVLKTPHVLTEVFPKLLERRTGMDVQA